MASPGKRPMAFVAEYQFGDDNLLTATHHEEMRIKYEERVRNTQSILKLEGLTIANGDLSPIHNLKRIQQELDRRGEIDQHNLILLQRLEHIHHQVPRQFDVSHHSEAVQNAPRVSNAGLRRRQHDQIELENQRMKRRLNKVKGTFDLKKLATDAERHQYFSDQLSKMGRRRKVLEMTKQLRDGAAAVAAVTSKSRHQCQLPEHFYVFQHQALRPVHPPSIGRYRTKFDDDWDDDEDVDMDEESGRYNEYGNDQREISTCSSSMTSWKLPPVVSSSSHKYVKSYASSPTVTKSAKVISAADLLNGFK